MALLTYITFDKSVSSVQKLERNGFIFEYVGPWGEDYTHNKTQR